MSAPWLVARVELTAEALREAEEAAAWYRDEAGVDVAERFERALAAALERIRVSPGRWPRIGQLVRRVRLARFPYLIVYVPRADASVVVAVAHQKRRPGYWGRRTHALAPLK